MSSFSRAMESRGPFFVFDHLTVEVHIWALIRDEDGSIKTWSLVYANPPALKTWGVTSLSDIVDKTTDEIFGAGATEHYLPVIEKIFETEEAHQFRDYFEQLEKHFLFTTIPLGDFFVTTGDDITDIVREKESVELANQELEQKITERAIRLEESEEKLRLEVLLSNERERIYSEMNKKRSQMLGVVAHELRTPVAAITMMASTDEPDEWLQSRQTVLRSCNDLLNTIDDMRLILYPDLSRPVRLEAFTISQLNSTVAAAIASTAASTSISFTLNNELGLDLLNTQFISDTYRIRIVLTNVLKNAFLHSDGTQVCFTTSLYTDADGQDYFQWEVEDNGKGIAPSEIARLFSAGQRGDTQAEGTGFGLYIAKSWIEEINGVIEHHPAQKGGTRFTVRVPKVKLESDSDQESRTSVAVTPEVVELLPKLNILFAEDDSLLRLLAEKILSKIGCTVSAFENGLLALEAFNESHNLIITDYFMPEMSGAELIQKLREGGYQGSIIGVTAATIGEQSQSLLDAGADIVLPKPFSTEGFQDALAQLVKTGRFDSLPGRASTQVIAPSDSSNRSH